MTAPHHGFATTRAELAARIHDLEEIEIPRLAQILTEERGNLGNEMHATLRLTAAQEELVSLRAQLAALGAP
jgi:hypothetical protein